jgi:negative regulator of sigma E activity
MLDRHVADRLAAFMDAETTPAESVRVRAHLESCAACQDARDRYQHASEVLQRLPRAVAPPDLWTRIERVLITRPASVTTVHGRWVPRLRAWVQLQPAYAAAVIIFAATLTLLFWQATRRESASSVTRLDLSAGELAVRVGEWVETNASSNAVLKIGTIGTVEVAPNTRMQVLAAQPDEHRLNLARGTISAQIIAPPRLFFVNTPSSTVVDLGCAYTMTVDEAGVGLLRVTGGWASLEWGGRESLVPAGASCPTRPNVGPGTPAFDDASEPLKESLRAFDFENGGGDALATVLKEARLRDTLTLWHLLSRVNPEDRASVFDRMLSFGPLPKGVSRDDVLALDAETLTRWREELAWTW